MPLAQGGIRSPCRLTLFIQVTFAADSYLGVPTKKPHPKILPDWLFAVLCFVGTFHLIKAPRKDRTSFSIWTLFFFLFSFFQKQMFLSRCYFYLVLSVKLPKKELCLARSYWEMREKLMSLCLLIYSYTNKLLGEHCWCCTTEHSYVKKWSN